MREVDLESTSEGGVKVTDTILLRKYIEESGLKLQFIADKIGITRPSLTNKITNASEFKASEIQALCDLLGIDDPADQRRVFFYAKEVDS